MKNKMALIFIAVMALVLTGCGAGQQDSKENDRSQKIKIMDLEGEKVRSIEGDSGEYLKPIGFVESDFVYGSAKAAEVAEDSAGNARFLMYKVTITDKNSKTVKEYQRMGITFPMRM